MSEVLFLENLPTEFDTEQMRSFVTDKAQCADSDISEILMGHKALEEDGPEVEGSYAYIKFESLVKAEEAIEGLQG